MRKNMMMEKTRVKMKIMFKIDLRLRGDEEDQT